jgi:hypothetical protein
VLSDVPNGFGDGLTRRKYVSRLFDLKKHCQD